MIFLIPVIAKVYELCINYVLYLDKITQRIFNAVIDNISWYKLGKHKNFSKIRVMGFIFFIEDIYYFLANHLTKNGYIKNNS